MRYCKLLMISESNNNKFYIMEETSEGIKVTYGRVGNTGITEISNKSWDSLKKSKIKKGYVDVTDLVTETTTASDYSQETDNEVHNFVSKMRAYMKGLVQKTYKKAESVTLAQINKAQEILDKLKNYVSDNESNKLLLELYTIIPRNMHKVQYHLLPHIKLSEIIQSEQDNIDAVKGYISQFKPTSNSEEQSYLQSIKVDLKAIKDVPSEIKYITDQLRKPYKLFEAATWEKLACEDKAKRFLIHGTRNSSVLPIMEQGLKIRPSGNFSFSGKAYGEGLYFGETVSKSLNYTGYDEDKVFLIYEVVVGNPYNYVGWNRGTEFTLNYEELQKRGYDSTYVTPGNGLREPEIIVYKENVVKLKYIILTS